MAWVSVHTKGIIKQVIYLENRQWLTNKERNGRKLEPD